MDGLPGMWVPAPLPRESFSGMRGHQEETVPEPAEPLGGVVLGKGGSGTENEKGCASVALPTLPVSKCRLPQLQLLSPCQRDVWWPHSPHFQAGTPPPPPRRRTAQASSLAGPTHSADAESKQHQLLPLPGLLPVAPERLALGAASHFTAIAAWPRTGDCSSAITVSRL